MAENIVGSKVREARFREGKKISRAELAARLQTAGIDMDRSAISRVENGGRGVSDREVAAIAEALGVSIAWLFGQEPQ